MLEHLHLHLTGKVVILGIGNTLKSDDAAGSVIASALDKRLPYTIYDAGANPENYLGSIIKDKPDNIIIIDAADFGGSPGELRLEEPHGVETSGMFFTHNSSLWMCADYLQKHLPADIIVLLIQPKTLSFGDEMSPEVSASVYRLKDWFLKSAV